MTFKVRPKGWEGVNYANGKIYPDKNWALTEHKNGVRDWTAFSWNSYAEALIPTVIMLGDRAFKEWLRLNEVIRMSP